MERIQVTGIWQQDLEPERLAHLLLELLLTTERGEVPDSRPVDEPKVADEQEAA